MALTVCRAVGAHACAASSWGADAAGAAPVGCGPAVVVPRGSETGDPTVRGGQPRVHLEVVHEVREVLGTAEQVRALGEGGEGVPTLGEEAQGSDAVGSMGVPLSIIEPGTTRLSWGWVASHS